MLSTAMLGCVAVVFSLATYVPHRQDSERPRIADRLDAEAYGRDEADMR